MSVLSVALAAAAPLQAWILRSQKEIAAQLGNARPTVSRHGPAPVAVGMVKPRSRPGRGCQSAGDWQRADSEVV